MRIGAIENVPHREQGLPSVSPGLYSRSGLRNCQYSKTFPQVLATAVGLREAMAARKHLTWFCHLPSYNVAFGESPHASSCSPIRGLGLPRSPLERGTRTGVLRLRQGLDPGN